MRNMSRSLFTVMFVLMLATTQRALAQSPLAIDFDEAFTPDFLKRDHPTFKSMLLLDNEQAAIVESLLHDYNERFEAALHGVREELRAAQQAMGAEDPRVAEEREQIREEIAVLFEEMQNELKNVQPGSNAGEIQVKYEKHMEGLQQRLAKLTAQPIKSEDLAKLFDDASLRLERWREEKSRVRQSFVDDLLALINADQQARWPSLERRMLRERTLGRGRLQGEGVDLTMVVRDLRLENDKYAAIAQVMADYEVALDEALKRRNQQIDGSVRDMFQALQAENRAALTNSVARITEARVAVRNVNDDFASSAAGALGEDGTRLTQAYRQRAYPLVFRDTQVMRLIKAAQEMEGVSETQKQAIAQMRATYQAELAAMDEQVLAAVRQHEPDVITQREVMAMFPPTDENEETERVRPIDGMQQAINRRNDAGKQYFPQLEALLGEEMYQRLPRNNRIIREPGDDDGDDGGSDNDE